jgi:hypothetical protein
VKQGVVVANEGACRIFETDETLQQWKLLQTLEQGKTFAREVGECVNEALTRGEWERVVLVAPEAFLGQLEAELSEGARRQVAGKIAQDLAQMPAPALSSEVRAHLPAPVVPDPEC